MLHTEHWQDALARQEKLEEESTSLGVERFKRSLEKAQDQERGSLVGAARKLMVEAIEPTEKAIAQMVEENTGGYTVKRWMKKLEKTAPSPESNAAAVAAFLTARVVLDGVHTGKQDAKTVAKHIATLILHELRFRKFKAEAPALFQYRMSNYDTSSYAHRARSLSAAMKYAEVDVSKIDMPEAHKVQVGMRLLSCFIEATGIVESKNEHVTENGKVQQRLYIVPTEDTLKWLSESNDVLSALYPVKMPMVVPPLAWQAGERGGYRFGLRGRYSMVRAGHKRYREAEKGELPVVFEAINRLQDTAWQINPDVIGLVEAIERKGGGLAAVPEMENEPEPALVEIPEGTPEEQAKALKKENGYRIGLVKDRNYHRKLARIEYFNVMRVVKKMRGEDAFFFPFNCDFRGRLYPISDYLSPQGSDLEKALLRFTDAKPVGPDGGRWLAIHLMNCLGDTPGGQKVSKMTLEERVQWVYDHEDLVRRVAEDPLSNLVWADADEPLQFFAACCEWARYAASGYSEKHVSGLPVAMDGSCNGLQHLSAMFLDRRGGEAVNVTPNGRPHDVYAAISEAVLDRLESDTDALAIRWLTSGLVDRKLTKRPTMTFGYGSKVYGFTEQIMEYLRGLDNWHEIEEHFSDVDKETGEVVDRSFEAASYMARHIWAALEGVVVAAFGAMEWFQACARAVAAENKPVEWTVPLTGFPVVQAYFESKRKRVETVLAGSVVRPSIYENTSEVEEHRQVNGISPNIVHSLDAGALMLTVTQAAAEGIEAFGMVHDSYATVAGDAGLLARITRQEFVHLYRQDVAEILFGTFLQQVSDPEAIPLPPRKGTLDLGGVLASDYFFA